MIWFTTSRAEVSDRGRATRNGGRVAQTRASQRVRGFSPPFHGPRFWVLITLETRRPNRRGWARKCRSDVCLNYLGNLVGLGPFLTLNDLELYGVAFLQGLKTFALDGRVMNKDISSAVLTNKPVSFAVIEPLYFSLKSCHLRPP